LTSTAQPISRDELDELFHQVSNWGRWGPDDQRGTLNLITPDKVRQAAGLVKEGVSVSCSLPLNTAGGIENPTPVMHAMLRAGDTEEATASLDYFAIASHGIAHTHLDALCHIFYKGRMYNRPISMVTSTGALANSIESGTDGIVSRGLLFDMPRALGKAWLDPGEAIYPEDLEAAERELGVSLEAGDVLLLRTGRHQRRAALGAPTLSPMAEGLAGIHVTCLPWLRERGIAVLGCDGVSDVTPSGLEGGGLPVHSLIIPAMGVHLLDNAQFDGLAEACSRYGRWQFMLTMAPLRLLRGTASPVNPIAMF
jgi:kynurenine formamidase